MGRIRYKRMCEKDGEIVDFDHIVKGYEYEKDRYVVLTDEDFDKVPVESSRAIDIQQFVDLEEIDPMMYKKSYYLIPEETGAKAYALLREAMSQDNKVGIAKVSFRDKEHLAALRFPAMRSCWRRCTGPTSCARPTSVARRSITRSAGRNSRWRAS